jgi:hypothetical protein
MAKAKNASEWGKATAKERYESVVQDDSASRGGGKGAIVGLINQPKLDEMSREMQAPQAINDHHGHAYDNDTTGWVRGMAKEPYPKFDKRREGKN